MSKRRCFVALSHMHCTCIDLPACQLHSLVGWGTALAALAQLQGPVPQNFEGQERQPLLLLHWTLLFDISSSSLAGLLVLGCFDVVTCATHQVSPPAGIMQWWTARASST
jgi:hypothetical protein